MLNADPAHLLAAIASALLSAGALAGTAGASGTGTRFAPPPAVAAAPPLATTPIQPVPPPEAAIPTSPPVASTAPAASAAPSALRPGAGSWLGPSWLGPSWLSPSWGGPLWPGQYRPVGPRDSGPSPSYPDGAGVAANREPSERPWLSPSPSVDGPLPGSQAPAWRAASAPIAVGPPAYLPALLIIAGLFSLAVSGTGLVVVARLRRQW